MRHRIVRRSDKPRRVGSLKATNIGERVRVEFRTEITNLFNRRNFGVPNTAIDSGVFVPNGTVLTTFQNPGASGINGGSRSVRLGLKVIF